MKNAAKQSPVDRPNGPRNKIHAARRHPLQERTQRKVMQILKATAQLIEEMPLEEISTTHIAKAAKITTGTVYRFFPHREAIFENLLIGYMDKFYEMYVEGLAKTQAKDGAEITSEMIDLQVKFMRSHPGVRELWTSRRVSPLILQRLQGSSSKVPPIAKETIQKRFGLKITPELNRRMAISAEIGDNVLAFAFRQPEPECSAIIAELKRMLTFLVFGPLDSPISHNNRKPTKVKIKQKAAK